ncbi:rod shape-determining protein [Kitasatospora sp. NPDC049285]|uniref:rod shape-determining protein n=1 Tax=Kitasatospora sp. NPDC049285 TaxID=3157096 RepID=UPI00342C5583
MLWWALDDIRLQVTGRSARFSQVVVELAWNPGAGPAAAGAVEEVARGMANAPWLGAPIGSVVLVAAGGEAHPGVGPAVGTVRELWPAAVVRVVDEALAAVLGAGLAAEPAACVVVHQDAERTSVAVVAGREVVAGGLAVGGARGLATALIGHLRAAHRLDVGPQMAWASVVHGGAFAPSPWVSEPGPVYGSVVPWDGSGPREPGRATLQPAETRAVLTPAYLRVAELVTRVLRDAPPEVVRQAAVGGLLLTGPHPPGADLHLAGLTGLPAQAVAEPGRGAHRPLVLLDGVARLLAESPPEPALGDPAEAEQRLRDALARLTALLGGAPR